jgi:hypothetical protein
MLTSSTVLEWTTRLPTLWSQSLLDLLLSAATLGAALAESICRWMC